MRIASLLPLALVVSCSRPPAPALELASRDDAGARSTDAGEVRAADACGRKEGPKCLRFDTAAAAFRHVLATEPAIVGIGEAHAQKGTEAIASTTKRFTEELLPVVAPRASDVVVELWAPNPGCQREVKAVAKAQKPVVERQADTNQNEYVTLGTRAKELGVTPWLLRPTCEDFASLADAGADSVPEMLRLVKRLTQEKLVQLARKNGGGDSGKPAKVVLAYGGAMHNDLRPSAEGAEFAFGAELDRATGGGYAELDLIVPEFVKDTPAWQKLPWYAAWQADAKPKDKATLFVLAERSFVLVLPSKTLE